MWTEHQFKQHKEAARLLRKIIDEATEFIKHNSKITEHEVQEFVYRRFKNYDLKTDKMPQIVAFRQNTSFVHYFPSQYCRTIKPESLIMIDIWARVNQTGSPFADITWMVYKGKKIPEKITKIFEIVIEARNRTLNFLKEGLKDNIIPKGKELDAVARGYIKSCGYGSNFPHNTGHSLGLFNPHGTSGKLSPKNDKTLISNMGYTIEPGIYLKNEFGIRSEIDCFISNDRKLILTTELQENIIKI